MLHYYYIALRTFEADANLHDQNIRSAGGSPTKMVFPPVAKKAKADEDADTDEEVNEENPLVGDEAGAATPRPFRIIIRTLTEMSKEKFEEASVNSKWLKTLNKLPLVIVIADSAFLSGLSILMVKVADTII